MKNYKFCIIKSEFNEEINNNLLKGVEKCITENSNLSIKTNVINVPGSFEIPYICNRLVNGKKKYNAIITLGCIIKGQTAHFEYISASVINSLANLNAKSNIPILLGIITSYDRNQALNRSMTNFDEENNLNIGYNACSAAIKLLSLKNA